jgi:hypothetical protein
MASTSPFFLASRTTSRAWLYAVRLALVASISALPASLPTISVSCFCRPEM